MAFKQYSRGPWLRSTDVSMQHRGPCRLQPFLGGDNLAKVYIRVYICTMAKRYSIAEARSNLPSIVDQAEAGQEIELTRRGKPVAVVVSLRELERLRGERVPFGEAYRRFLKAHQLREVGADENIFASARDRDPGRKVSL